MAKSRAACEEFKMAFHGAKLAILVGDQVVTLLRDDLPELAYANHWDLPGGAREGRETPIDCVLRELREELGMVFSEEDLHHGFECNAKDGISWFFVSKPVDFDTSRVVFGNEGQAWTLAKIDWFLNYALAIPILVTRLRSFLEKGHPCA
jgi:8-oxo-dGTP diphosphatase